MDDFSEKRTKTSGFTLIEFMIAMTIAAVLGGIVLPVGKRLIHKAQRESDRQKLQYLALEYAAAWTEGRLLYDKKKHKDMRDFARAWAERGGPATLDAYRSCKTLGKSKKKIPLTDERIQSGDFDFIALFPPCPEMSPDAVPVFYSRGLQNDGTWAGNSLYGTEGGFIAFMDGEVGFFNSAKTWASKLGEFYNNFSPQ